MFFYFSLPQTLLRQLAAFGEASGEYKYVFVPEGQHSKSGRDNKANFEISREILLSVLGVTELLVNSSTRPLHMTRLDGMGDELLRGVPTYGWDAPSVCGFIVQHSCLSWEGVNLRAFVRPDFVARAIKRTLKRYGRTKFSKLWMYTGTADLSLRQAHHISQRINTISHYQLANTCQLVNQNSNFFHRLPGFEFSEEQSILFLPAGRCQKSFYRVLEYAQRENYTLYIKAHPQQIADFEFKSHTTLTKVVLVSDESVPVELLIQQLMPRWIVGPKSSIEYFSETEYVFYEPERWPQKNEANLLDKYRRILTEKAPVKLEDVFL